MDAITPQHSSAVLLLIMAAAVGTLLVLILKVKLHAFVSLVLVSVLTALAVGFPIGDIPDALMYGFMDTIGGVALLVAFGVMLGRLLESTGGAQTLADTLIVRFGEKRAPLALGVAALLFGFPIFFDAGLVIFMPIILTVARRFGGSVLLYALPAASAFAAMHATVPPHPGPVAAATQLDGSVGLTLLVGLPIAVTAWYVGGYLVSQVLGKKVHVDVADIVFGEVNDGRSDTSLGRRRPAFGLVVGILAVPLVLIGLNTVLTTLMDAGTIDGNGFVDFLVLVGETPVALMITLLAAIAVLARPRGDMATITGLMDASLGPVCSVILVTGAGGMFGGILELSGVGEALSSSLAGIGLPLIVQAFLVASLLRVAQGSATVAITTTAPLMAHAARAADITDVHVVLLTLAIAAGATVLSHLNDSGFWLVSRFLGMDEATTLRTWTVIETTLGVAVFLLASLVWAVI